jgi:RNA polymerase sigma-70 factor (ECF subfamily)
MDVSPSLARFADDVLIRLVITRRQDALDELYTRYSRLIFGIALQMLQQDRAAAEEVTLDIFVSVWQHAATYRADRAKVSTWLTSMTRHRCIDRLRTLQTRPEGHAVGWDDLAASGEAEIASDLGAEGIVQRARVQSALRELPDEQAEVIILAHYYGLSQSEMAATLGLPLGTVKTRVRLAMQKLRSLLQEEI